MQEKCVIESVIENGESGTMRKTSGSVPLSEKLHLIVPAKLTTAVPRGKCMIVVKKNRQQSWSLSSGADDRAGEEKEKRKKVQREYFASRKRNSFMTN